MKADEVELLLALGEAREGNVGESGPVFPRDLARQLEVAPKRASYLFAKWSTRGWYASGTSLDLGWLTADGIVMLAERGPILRYLRLSHRQRARREATGSTT